MHPDKAEALAQIAESSRELDLEIEELKDAIQHPGRNGLGTSLRALATLPILGVVAVLVDAAEVSIRRTSDSLWEDPPTGRTALPPGGESREGAQG